MSDYKDFQERFKLLVSKNKHLVVPNTEGIKYAGSKLKLLPYILDIISEFGASNVLDGFSGSTRVSQAFAKLGFDTTSSDISVWSETFATAYLLNEKPPKHYQARTNGNHQYVRNFGKGPGN